MMIQFNRLISDCGHALVHERQRQFFIRRQVEVGKENLTFAHLGILHCNWFFNFHDHVRALPHLIRGGNDLCSGV